MPSVSIIVPNYNHARFLKQRLDSIFHQTYQDFELIILDDASTDNSIELIKLYENHSKVSQIILNTENSDSTFRQWKKGIELAKGDFIWIAESDDYNSENFLEESIDNFKRNDHIGLVFGKIELVNEYGAIIKDRVPLKSGEYSGTFLLENYFGKGNLIINGSSAVFKKELIIDKLNTLQNFKICGDWFLWSNIALKEDIAFTESSVTYYRKHSSAASNNLYSNSTFYLESFIIINHIKKAILLNERLFLFWYKRIQKEVIEEKTGDFLIKKLKKLFGPRSIIYTAKYRSKSFVKRLIYDR